METYQRLIKLSGAIFPIPLGSFTILHGIKWLLKTWHRMFFINFIDILKNLDLNLRLQPICTESISTQLTLGLLGINGKIFFQNLTKDTPTSKFFFPFKENFGMRGVFCKILKENSSIYSKNFSVIINTPNICHRVRYESKETNQAS